MKKCWHAPPCVTWPLISNLQTNRNREMLVFSSLLLDEASPSAQWHTSSAHPFSLLRLTPKCSTGAWALNILGFSVSHYHIKCIIQRKYYRVAKKIRIKKLNNGSPPQRWRSRCSAESRTQVPGTWNLTSLFQYKPNFNKSVFQTKATKDKY